MIFTRCCVDRGLRLDIRRPGDGGWLRAGRPHRRGSRHLRRLCFPQGLSREVPVGPIVRAVNGRKWRIHRIRLDGGERPVPAGSKPDHGFVECDLLRRAPADRLEAGSLHPVVHGRTIALAAEPLRSRYSIRKGQYVQTELDARPHQLARRRRTLYEPEPNLGTGIVEVADREMIEVNASRDPRPSSPIRSLRPRRRGPRTRYRPRRGRGSRGRSDRDDRRWSVRIGSAGDRGHRVGGRRAAPADW